MLRRNWCITAVRLSLTGLTQACALQLEMLPLEEAPVLRGEPHSGQVCHERAGLERRRMPSAAGRAQQGHPQGKDRAGSAGCRFDQGITTAYRMPGIFSFRAFCHIIEMRRRARRATCRIRRAPAGRLRLPSIRTRPQALGRRETARRHRARPAQEPGAAHLRRGYVSARLEDREHHQGHSIRP